MSFQRQNTVLFQGDSITDASRRRGRKGPSDPAALGHGYVFHTAATLMLRHPDLDLQIYNRGISGDKVWQLADRWEKDCLALRPDVLSILVGVNDFWHIYTHGYAGTVPDYQHDYDTLLDRTRSILPNVKLVLCEPFMLEVADIPAAFVEAIGAYQEAARRLAEQYDAVWVPFQMAFNEALQVAPADYWAPDGVHPTLPGHMLMARTWLDAVEPEP